MIMLSEDGAKPRGTNRRNRINATFRTLCILATLLSVLALASLLSVVLLLGSKYLIGITPTVLPDTETIAEVDYDPSSAEVTFRYAEELDKIPDTFVIPPSLEPAQNAEPYQAPDGHYTIDLANGDALQLTDTGSGFQRLSLVGRLDLTTFGDFITGTASTNPRTAGFLPPILGSAAILLVCLFTALPLGVGTAILMQEFKPKHRVLRVVHNILQINIRNLAGVPSVVYGLLGLTAFVRLFGLLGAPGQYDNIDAITLRDGSTIIGQAVRSQPYTLTSEFFGELPLPAELLTPLTDVPTPSEPIDAQATINMLADSFTIAIDGNGTIEIPLNRVSIDPAKLFGSPDIEPTEFPLIQPITLSDTAGYLVETLGSGRQLLSTADIAEDDDAVRIRQVRHHKFTLRQGSTIERIERRPTRTGGYEISSIEPEELQDQRTIKGSDIDINNGIITLGPKGGWEEGGIRFDASQYTNYDPAFAVQVGKPTAWYHIRLPLQTSVLAGGLTLMLVILPVIIIASQEALSAVPNSLRQGALALGASKLQTVGKLTLPKALPSIMTGTILAMSRAVGEAAPILVIGAATVVTFTPRNLMSEFSAMPLNIYAWSKLPNKEFVHVTASGIIILLAILLTFNAVAILIRHKLADKA